MKRESEVTRRGLLKVAGGLAATALGCGPRPTVPARPIAPDKPVGPTQDISVGTRSHHVSVGKTEYLNINGQLYAIKSTPEGQIFRAGKAPITLSSHLVPYARSKETPTTFEPTHEVYAFCNTQAVRTPKGGKPPEEAVELVFGKTPVTSTMLLYSAPTKALTADDRRLIERTNLERDFDTNDITIGGTAYYEFNTAELIKNHREEALPTAYIAIDQAKLSDPKLERAEDADRKVTETLNIYIVAPQWRPVDVGHPFTPVIKAPKPPVKPKLRNLKTISL